MKPVTNWNFTPYTPLDRPERAHDPYICRIAPGLTTLEFDFIDRGAKSKATHTLYYRVRGTDAPFTELYMENADKGQLCNLKPRTDYEFYVSDSTEKFRRFGQQVLEIEDLTVRKINIEKY